MRKIAFIITELRHFHYFQPLFLSLNDIAYDVVLNDSRLNDFPGVINWAQKNSISFRCASEVLEHEYELVISTPVDKKGGGKRLKLGWPFDILSTKSNKAPGKTLNRLRWPKNVLINILKLAFHDGIFSPFLVDLPVSDRIGQKKILIPDGLDGALYPGYPFSEVYDIFLYFSEHQKNGIIRCCEKPMIPAPYVLQSSDDFFGNSENEQTLSDIGSSVTKLAVLPGGKIYIDQLYELVDRLIELSNSFEITFRPHPDTMRKTGKNYKEFVSLFSDLDKCGVVVDTEFSKSHIETIRHSDMVICDAGAVVIDSYLMGVRVLRLTHPDFLKKTGIFAKDIDELSDAYPYNVLSFMSLNEIVLSKSHMKKNYDVTQLLRNKTNYMGKGEGALAWNRVAKRILSFLNK